MPVTKHRLTPRKFRLPYLALADVLLVLVRLFQKKVVRPGRLEFKENAKCTAQRLSNCIFLHAYFWSGDVWLVITGTFLTAGLELTYPASLITHTHTHTLLDGCSSSSRVFSFYVFPIGVRFCLAALCLLIFSMNVSASYFPKHQPVVSCKAKNIGYRSTDSGVTRHVLNPARSGEIMD